MRKRGDVQLVTAAPIGWLAQPAERDPFKFDDVGAAPTPPTKTMATRTGDRNRKVPTTCQWCGKVYLARADRVRSGRAKCCSVECARKIKKPVYGRFGAKNANWKGGLTKSERGYWYVYMPEHHRADKRGYVKRANVVAEQTIGRFLRDDEVVHHINRDKEDDRPENLQVMTSADHTALHAEENRKPAKKRGIPWSERYAWPPDHELVRMRQTMKLREIAAIIGCSAVSVHMHLKRIAAVAQTKVAAADS